MVALQVLIRLRWKNLKVAKKNNLYKIWIRMSSGTYFPPAVKAVPIPKKSGGVRTLGIPTISDRIAQTVVKMVLEPLLDPIFDEDSYGYRPNRCAHDAIAITRRRCWRYDFVIEFDIKGLFDNIDHALLMKALKKHCNCKWVLLYVERWLKAPMQDKDGNIVARTSGTPQVCCRRTMKQRKLHKLSISSIKDEGIDPSISAFRCGYQTTSSGYCKEQWS